MRFSTLRFLLPVALVAATASAQSTVIVVDPAGGPGSDFTDLQAAIDAAPEAAVLLLRDGAYGGFDIDGKGLYLVRDRNAVVTGTRSSVRNLPADAAVLLQGLELVDEPGDFSQSMLRMEANAGPVVLDRMLIDASSLPPTSVNELVRMVDCEAVVAARSDFFGSVGSQGLVGPGPFFPNDALQAVDSDLALFECNAVGGSGADGIWTGPDTFLLGQPGRAGAALQGGSMFASASDLRGGMGGAGPQSVSTGQCLPQQPGGPGLQMTMGAMAGPWVELLASRLEGGPGGSDPDCGTGLPGPANDLVAGQLFPLEGAAGLLETTSPVREGERTEIRIHGPEGAGVFLLMSPQVGRFPVEGIAGPVVALPPFTEIYAGVIPASGSLVLGGGVRDLGPGVESFIIWLQPLVVAPEATVAGTPAALVFLDRSF